MALSVLAYGQMDTTLLPDVDLWATQMPKAAGAQHIQVDPTVQPGYFRLSDAINARLPVYIRSYGPSAVATFSVRGTGGQHTDVLWNGMSVNSPMLGLFDLNLISPSAFDDIDMYYGGASPVSGASSFGGALNLSNTPRFDKHFGLGLLQELGSYQTSHTGFDLSASNGRVYWRTRLLWDRSLNNFEYTNPRLSNSPTFVNEHAEVNQDQWIQEAGVALGGHSKLVGRLWLQRSNRQLPSLLSLYTEPDPGSRSVQKDVQQRVQLEWIHAGKRFGSLLRSGISSWLIDFDHAVSIARSWQNQWRTTFHPDPALQAEALVQFVHEHGKAEPYPNGVAARSRGLASLAIMRKWDLISGEFQIRKELVSGSWSPFQYQIGGSATYGKEKQWNTRFRAAFQVRYPTLNDIFWGQSNAHDISPERGYQTELGQRYHFQFLSWVFEASVTGYTNRVGNYILWLPRNDLTWQATNVDQVNILGTETGLTARKDLPAGHLKMDLGYSYTRSRDQKGYQLIFIPLHQARACASYGWKSFTALVSFVFQGKVYTDRENEFYMPWYQTADLRLSYQWDWGKHQFAAFVQSMNFTDVTYQALPLRPMPGRTFQMGIRWYFSND